MHIDMFLNVFLNYKCTEGHGLISIKRKTVVVVRKIKYFIVITL